jgi:hypothetical protein
MQAAARLPVDRDLVCELLELTRQLASRRH